MYTARQSREGPSPHPLSYRQSSVHCGEPVNIERLRVQVNMLATPRHDCDSGTASISPQYIYVAVEAPTPSPLSALPKKALPFLLTSTPFPSPTLLVSSRCLKHIYTLVPFVDFDSISLFVLVSHMTHLLAKGCLHDRPRADLPYRLTSSNSPPNILYVVQY